MSRCVTCGWQKEAHGDDGLCPGSAGTVGKRFASMDLPEGKSCSDCHFLKHCTAFIGDVARNTSCDWYPIRFIQGVPK